CKAVRWIGALVYIALDFVMGNKDLLEAEIKLTRNNIKALIIDIVMACGHGGVDAGGAAEPARGLAQAGDGRRQDGERSVRADGIQRDTAPDGEKTSGN
ncbi:hypothetical protein EJB05_11338, partial [Eragrostis curvula]